MRGHIRKHKDRWAGVIYLGKDSFGKKQYKWIYDTDYKACQRKVNEFICKYEKGAYVEPSSYTFKQWCDKWFETHKLKVEPNTTREYESVIRLYLPPLYDMKMKDLKSLHIQTLYNNLLEKKKSAYVVRKVHKVLSICLRSAYKQEVIERNLMDFVELPTYTKPAPVIVTRDMFMDAFEKADTCEDVYMKILIILCGICGLRIGEALGLQKDKINLKTGLIIIDHQLVYENKQLVLKAKLKTDTSKRNAYIPPDFIKYFDEYLKKLKKHIKEYEKYTNMPYNDKNMLICKDNGEYIYPKTVERHWKKFLEDNNIPFFRIHDGRHFSATLQLKCGIPEKIIKGNLGHAKLDMTHYYQYLDMEQQEENAKKITINSVKK